MVIGQGIRKFRTQLMGIAILWVCLCHINSLGARIPFIGDIVYTGYAGVDIFLYVSGFGLFFSLSKNQNLYEYYKKRIIRLLPFYYPVLILFFVFKYLCHDLHLDQVIGNITMTGVWRQTSGQFNWYMEAIFFFYLIAPFIYYVLVSSKKKYAIIVALMVASVIMSINYLDDRNALAAVSRIPIFILGMWVAYENVNEKKLLSVHRVISDIVMISGMVWIVWMIRCMNWDVMWRYGLWWYPFFLIIPNLCRIFSIVLQFCSEKLSFVDKALQAVGKCSFEIFLWQILVFTILDYINFIYSIAHIQLARLLSLLFVIPFAMLYHKVVLKLIGKN